jgi:hypothetical protein
VVVTSLAGKLSSHFPYYLLPLSLELIVRKFQVWRLLTPFLCFGRVDFSWLFNMMFL